MMQNETLYQAIRNLPFEPNFLARLRRENRWSRAYAERAITEYQRFVYLAAIAPQPVTPSEAVDQVWHLHLLYTRSYWDDLCAGLLGRPLHHGPSAGGPAEAAKFADWYEATLALYRLEFDLEPPADLWPPTPQRFNPIHRWAWINTAECWLIPKPQWWNQTLSVSLPLLFFPAVLIPIALVGLFLFYLAHAGSKTEKKRSSSGAADGIIDVASDAIDCGGADCGDGGSGCSSGCGGGCGGGD